MQYASFLLEFMFAFVMLGEHKVATKIVLFDKIVCCVRIMFLLFTVIMQLFFLEAHLSVYLYASVSDFILPAATRAQKLWQFQI